ncbi:MAG: outer membrane beta-barrel protein [Paludibacteraceae bacterium]|nr:outer membrane beta-barrel protein [Paludibacteraceae bacterium]
MKLVFRKIAWLMLALLPQVASAQDKLFNISLGGGLEVLNYTPEIGKPKPGGGVMFEWQFQHFIVNNFGYGVGVGLSYFTANYYINETIEKQVTETETDAGVPYILRTIFNDFNEKQRTFQIEVPIGLYARFFLNDYSQFIIGAGPKLAFPLISKYEYSRGSVETRAYFGGDIEAELSNIPHHGLYKQDANGDDDIDTDLPLISVYVDMMWTRALNNSSALHIGGYLSYGLSDMVSNHDATMGISKKSILNSTLTEKVIPICVGMKVGVTLPLKKGGKRSIFDGF